MVSTLSAESYFRSIKRIEMYAELYQYLIQYKQLTVPGIGTFLLERKPAQIDFPNRKISPPAYTITLRSPGNSASKKFFAWLANALHISDRDAIVRFNDFAFDMKKQVSAGDVIRWNGIGTLSKGLAGEIKFNPFINELVFEQPVTAEKVMREKAEHMVRVGEEERTSVEMMQLLSQSGEKRSYWWAFALIAGLLAIMFIGWYFSEHGLNVTSAGNGKKLNPQKAAATYKILP
jgi:hypothetical protein